MSRILFFFAQRAVPERPALRAGKAEQTCARELAALLRPMKNCHINLIAVNPVRGRDFARPGESGVRAFADILQKHGYTVTVRRSVGGDISGSCGQLRLGREKKGE